MIVYIFWEEARRKIAKHAKRNVMTKKKETEARADGSPALREKLARMEDLYQSVVEDQSEFICRFLPDGTMTFANSAYCEFFGVAPDEIIGKRYAPVVHEEDLAEVQAQANAMTPDNPTRVTENRVHRFDGEIRWTQWVCHAFFDENGTKVEEQAVGRDITEQKQAEKENDRQREQLMLADKLISLGTLVSGVAHEINNPNNFMLLNAEALKDAWEHAVPILDRHYEKVGDFKLGNLSYSRLRDNASNLFDGIIEGGNRIKGIIDELRNFSRQDESGDMEQVDLNEVVVAAKTIMANVIKKSTSRFSTQFDTALPQVRGSFQKFQQVLINLIQNACDALDDKNQAIAITSRFDRQANEIVLAVSDEGIGVSEQTLSRIDDPFFTTKRVADRLGLGLSICKHIIHLFHGSIHYKSLPNQGMTVEIRLPSADTASQS